MKQLPVLKSLSRPDNFLKYVGLQATSVGYNKPSTHLVYIGFNRPVNVVYKKRIMWRVFFLMWFWTKWISARTSALPCYIRRIISIFLWCLAKGLESSSPKKWVMIRIPALSLVSRSTLLFAFFRKKWSRKFRFKRNILFTIFSEITTNAIQCNIRRNCLFSEIALNGFFH